MPDLYIISEKLSQLINISDKTLENIRQQKIWSVSKNILVLSDLLQGFFSHATNVFDSVIMSNLLSYVQNILDAQENKDYVLLGDFIEINLLPAFYEMQGMILSNITLPDKELFIKNYELLKELNLCDKSLLTILENWYKHYDGNIQKLADKQHIEYSIEPSNSGFLTLSKTTNGKCHYLHSNANPQKEAYLFAKSHSDHQHFEYSVIGLGLGYHIAALLDDDARNQVTVIEPDLNIIGLMLSMGQLDLQANHERFRLVYSSELTELKHYATNDCQLLIHHPTLMAMTESPAKEALKKYFLQYSSVYEQKQSLDENFYYNQKLEDSPIDELKELFYQKTVIYLGGGPSAQTKLPYIKEFLNSHPDAVTICAGTVYRTLLAADFVPDYVIITDPQPILIRQTQNIPETKTKLLYLSTASHSAVKAFCGKRYIIYQKDYEQSDYTAHRHGYLQVSTGGSVSTTAIDLCICSNCKKLITTGLDLSFPTGKTHAFNLSDDVSQNLAYQMTTDIYGNPVQTSSNLKAYQEWIEKRIQKITDIEFVNVTDGVCIQGMNNTKHLNI